MHRLICVLRPNLMGRLLAASRRPLPRLMAGLFAPISSAGLFVSFFAHRRQFASGGDLNARLLSAHNLKALQGGRTLVKLVRAPGRGGAPGGVGRALPGAPFDREGPSQLSCVELTSTLLSTPLHGKIPAPADSDPSRADQGDAAKADQRQR